MKICNIPGCGRKHEAKGYCSKHYKRIVLKGSRNLSLEDLRRFVPDPIERFFNKITIMKYTIVVPITIGEWMLVMDWLYQKRWIWPA